MKPPIIDHSRRRSRGRRAATGAVTAAAWALYAWLWAPLITALAWLLGVQTAWFQLYLRQHEIDLFVLSLLPLIALTSGALLIGWAEYNRVRFAKADHRRRRPAIDEDSVRSALGATPVLAEKLRDGRIVHVALDDDARPVAASLGS
ncbi:poly-beta-1,6-N-acetyl-D-glucosamine biosynthesis protein PgaD [Lysobacteraceae bacterium NML91-0213]|nr:poly-beta-1,6-N-acetyl-D-glucosamine biosynthesis protein PgaD [Xanthomonadaceae bacterium NML91-0213]